MPETRKYTVVDLFAGVGGLSYGFSRNEHYEIILANEMQKDIAKAYSLNHPSVNMLQGDIKDLSEDILRQARSTIISLSEAFLCSLLMMATANTFLSMKTAKPYTQIALKQKNMPCVFSIHIAKA